MDTLYWKDLSKLSIFNCKVCKYRLQYPVMTVELFGNICGRCCEKSVFTHVRKNTDVGAILSKLYMPCRYEKRGCDFESSYIKICKHEKQCHFRDKICPFVYVDKCECFLVEDLIKHILEEHDENIIIGNKNLILIPNCNDVKCDMFYLLNVDNKYFLFQCIFDIKNKIYQYALYYFANDNRSLDKVSFTFIAEYENLDVKSKKTDGISDLFIARGFNVDSALTISLSMLNNLTCSDTINISINFDDRVNIEYDKKSLEWFVCISCDDYCVEGAYYCYFCYNKLKKCSNCFKESNKCPSCDRYFNAKITDFAPMNALFKFPCRNKKCKEIIQGDLYETHILNCTFRNFTCPYKEDDECSWEGIYTNMYDHVHKLHFEQTKYVDKLCILTEVYNEWHMACILKYNNIFECDYLLTDEEMFILKIGILGPAYLENVYAWEVHIIKRNSARNMILSDVCDCFDTAIKKSINVSEYLTDKQLAFRVFIKPNIKQL